MIFKAKPKAEQLDQYLAKRDYASALDAISEEIKRKPENFNLLLRKAEILGLAGDRDQAITAYRDLARYFAEQGFYARAIAVTNKILRLDPQRQEVTKELAALIAAQQEAEKASREKLQRAALAPVSAQQPGAEGPGAAAPLKRGAPAPPAGPDEVTPPSAATGAGPRATAKAPSAAPSPPHAKPLSPPTPAPPPLDAEVTPEQAERERDASQFFAAFPRPALEQLLSSTSVRSFELDEVIMREGDPGTSMFLIVDGAVEVQTRDTAGRPLVLAQLGPGEFFGEVAMLTGRPRTASVVARDRVTVVEVTREDHDTLVATFPEVGEVLQRFHEQRVNATVEAMLARLRSSNG